MHQDLVAPFVFGYFTHFWFGIDNPPNELSSDEICGFGGVLARYSMSRGVEAAAFENGLLLFDFSKCAETPIVIHRESLWNGLSAGESADPKITSRLQRAEKQQRRNQSFYRTVLIAHALLLESAGQRVVGASFSLPRIESLGDALGCHAISKIRSRTSLSKSSFVLGRDVIEASFADLDRTLEMRENVLRTLELHKVSHYRFFDHRFAECLVISWTVCENLVDFLWRRMIDEIRASNPPRMSKKRVDTLSNSSAFTASIRIETLELSGLIATEQAGELNNVRKARNAWLHSLQDVDESAALHSLRVCARLNSSIFGVPLSEHIVAGAGGEGGGMNMEVFRGRFPEFDLTSAYDG